MKTGKWIPRQPGEMDPVPLYLPAWGESPAYRALVAIRDLKHVQYEFLKPLGETDEDRTVE